MIKNSIIRKLGRNERAEFLDKIALDKQREGEGILQTFKGNPISYSTRETATVERGGKPMTEDKRYDTGPKHKDSVKEVRPVSRSLSTRYSPDRVGVQTMRVSDDVTKDPYTGREYNWREGFTTETGEVFDGGDVGLQTDLDF